MNEIRMSEFHFSDFQRMLAQSPRDLPRLRALMRTSLARVWDKTLEAPRGER